MTPPPIRYRSPLSGLRPLTLEIPDTASARERLGDLGTSAATLHEAEEARHSTAMHSLGTSGYETHSRGLLEQPFARAETGRLEGVLPTLLAGAREGNRRNYYDAMMISYVVVHRSLEDGHRDQARTRVRQFREITTEYQDFLHDNDDLGIEEKLRYLFAASRVTRTMLGRLEADSDFVRNYPSEISELRTLLGGIYNQLEEYHQSFIVANPGETRLAGILREVQLRRAVLENHPDVARQRATELLAFYQAHPPVEADPDREETNTWYASAGRELTQDTEFLQLLAGLDTPSTAEDSAVLLGGMTLELLQVIGSTLDSFNEEESDVIQNRYQSLGAVATALLLAIPGITVEEIISKLNDPAQSESLQELLGTISEQNPQIRELLDGARGEQNLASLFNRARGAAEHVHDWAIGAGHDILEQLFFCSNAEQRVHRVSAFLSNHPELAVSLGYSRAGLEREDSRRNFAVDLIRRGDTAVDIIEAYGDRHPGDPVEGLIRDLREAGESSRDVNRFIDQFLNRLQPMMEAQPDHGVPILHALFQVIAETEEIAEGIRLEPQHRALAQHLAGEFESFGFRAGRVVDHLTSPSSLATLGLGILAGELLPLALVGRASAEGRLAAPLIGDLVNAGRLTTAGSVVTGLGTGLTMSAIGSFLHNRGRARLGFTTHYGRDFGESALINSVTFGLTVPFSRYLSNRLASVAEEGNAIGSLTRSQALLAHTGTALFGGSVALGVGFTYRGLTTGQWNSSWDEVAENYLSLLAWEMGSAVVRRGRTFGLRAELQGRPLLEPLEIETPEGAGRIRRASDGARRGFRRGIAALGNLLVTNLGPHRARLVNAAADRVVAENPDVLGPQRDFITRQLGLQELADPGSISRYNEAFLRGMMPYLTGPRGRPRLTFVPRPDLILEGYFTPPRPSTPAPRAEAAAAASESSAPLEGSEPSSEGAARSEPPSSTPGRAPRSLGEWNEAALNQILDLPSLHESLSALKRTLETYTSSREGPFDLTVIYYPEQGRIATSTDTRPTSADVREASILLRGRYNPETQTLTLPTLGGRGGTRVSIRFSGEHPVIRVGERRIPVRPPEGGPPDGSAPPEGSPSPPSDGTPPPVASPPAAGPTAESRAGIDPARAPMPTGARPMPVDGAPWGQELLLQLVGIPDVESVFRSIASRLDGNFLNRSEFSLIFEPEAGTLEFSTDTRLSSSPYISIAIRYDRAAQVMTLPPMGENGTPISIHFSGETPQLHIGERIIPLHTPEVTPIEEEPTNPRAMVVGTPEASAMPRLSTLPALSVGDVLMTVDRIEPVGIRRGRHLALVEGLGEIGAFTHEGISKHNPPRNEDSYGIVRLPNGVLLMVADGMGGEGNQTLQPGEMASGRAVRTVFDLFQNGLDLGTAFRGAHETIRAEGHGGATVATALHVLPGGTGRIAYAGDTRCFIVRPRPDGSYEVFEAYLPQSIVGAMRQHHGARPGFDTLAMHSHPRANIVLGGLGIGEAPNVIVQDLSILRAGPGDQWVAEPFQFRTGDVALLMSDGVAELFNRDQIGETLRGRTGIEEILNGMHDETQSRLDLFRSFWGFPQDSASGRRSIPEGHGTFSDRYIDERGDIYDALHGGNLMGHIQPDNVALVAFRYDPSVRAETAVVSPSSE